MAKQKITNSQLNLPQGSGYLYIGTMLIQWGTATTGSVGTGAFTEVNKSVTFPITFSATPVFIATPSDFNNACGEYLSLGTINSSSATVWVGHAAASSPAATNTFNWIAIGAA